MFERVINQLLTEGRDALTNGSPVTGQTALERLFAQPGWEDEEVQKLLAYWNAEGEPTIVHGYPREVTQFPCWAITLTTESEDREYIGHDGVGLAGAEELVAQVEKETGQVVDARVRRMKLSYDVITYAENPDVCLAYHNVARKLIFGGDRTLEAACFEDVTFTSMDLMPLPQYLPTNLFTRKITITGFAHVLYTEVLDLGPLAIGRGKSVDRIYVADNVVGVNPGLTVPSLDEE